MHEAMGALDAWIRIFDALAFFPECFSVEDLQYGRPSLVLSGQGIVRCARNLGHAGENF